MLGYKAYYSAAVACGMMASCRDHAPIAVMVLPGRVARGVDPADWLAPVETTRLRPRSRS
jgi:hypothetical protein